MSFRHPEESQRTAAELVALVREAGFFVRDEAVSTPDPFWARPDFGAIDQLIARTGGRPRATGEPTQVNLVATSTRPG